MLKRGGRAELFGCKGGPDFAGIVLLAAEIVGSFAACALMLEPLSRKPEGRPESIACLGVFCEEVVPAACDPRTGAACTAGVEDGRGVGEGAALCARDEVACSTELGPVPCAATVVACRTGA